MSVKIHQLIKTFIVPWEDQNKSIGFFEEMFVNQFGPHKEFESISEPMDDSKPSFKKSLKGIFKDIYDLTGQSKLK